MKSIVLLALVFTASAQAATQEDLDFMNACFADPSGEGCTLETSNAASPLAGSTLELRGVDTTGPSISRDGVSVVFQRFNPRKAVFGDGDPTGTQIGFYTGSVRNVDNAGTAVGNDSGSAWASSIGTLDTDDAASNVYSQRDALDLVSDLLIVGTSSRSSVGYFSVWDVNVLRTEPSLDFGATARLNAVTLGGLFAAGESTSAATESQFGTQAVSFDTTSMTATPLPFLPGVPDSSKRSFGLGISDDASQIVGSAKDASGNRAPVEWTNGAIAQLPILAGDNEGEVNAISADGTVACGWSGDHAVAWDSTRSWVRRLDYMTGLTPAAGCTLSSCFDMDADADRFVGNATCADGTHVFEIETPVPLPEPSPALALSVGALGLMWLGKRR